MKGSAPKFEKTGSQTPVQRKLHPKACRAGAERTNSSIAIAPVITRTESAKVSAMSRKAVSAMRQRAAGQVKLAIGYASAAAASVIETRKSGGMLLAALAAAAVILSRLAATKRPPRFFTAPTGSLFCTA